MAVTIDVIVDNYFTWGSYPYDTWGGSDVVTWGSSANVRTIMTNTDTLGIVENSGKERQVTSFAIRKTANEAAISLKDYFSRNIIFGRNIEERFKAAETYWDNILFHINVLENVLVEDYSNRVANKIHKQPISLSEKNNARLNTVRLETIKTSEGYNHIAEFVRAVTERARVVEKHSNEYEYYHEAEPFCIEDYSNREYRINHYHTLTLKDADQRTSRFQRVLTDLINVAEKLINHVDKKQFEEMFAEDLYLKACEGILSNVYITEGEIDGYDFGRAIKTPPGYTEFMDFKVGEYEYQEALVRVTLDAVSQVQPTAQGIIMHVDIPDTDDRGTMVIANTSEPTRVDFHKPYYIIPEVQVTLRSASTSQGVVTPNIVNITKTYFTVELLTTGGARTSGVISWASKGY